MLIVWYNAYVEVNGKKRKCQEMLYRYFHTNMIAPVNHIIVSCYGFYLRYNTSLASSTYPRIDKFSVTSSLNCVYLKHKEEKGKKKKEKLILTE